MTCKRQICPLNFQEHRACQLSMRDLKVCHKADLHATCINPIVYVLLHSVLSKYIFTSASGPPSGHYLNIMMSISAHLSILQKNELQHKNKEFATTEGLQKSTDFNTASTVSQYCCPLSPLLFFSPMQHHTVLYIKFSQCWFNLFKVHPIIYQMNDFVEKVIRSLLSW